MTRNVLLILPALLCLAAAPAPKTAPAKAPAKAAAAKAPAAAAKPAAPADSGPFDATNPQALMGLLSTAGANVQTKAHEEDSVFVTVTSTAANFSMQFAGCTPQGRGCKAVLLDSPLDRSSVSGAQVNGFNQTSVLCRVYQDRAGLAHVLYSAVLTKTMTRDDGATHLLAWQNCIADGRAFLKDPVAYLAEAA